LRQSCGCLSNSVKLASLDTATIPEISSVKNTGEVNAFIKGELARIFAKEDLDIEKLCDTIFSGIERKDSEPFLDTLKKELNNPPQNDYENLPLDDFLSCLRRLILPYLTEPTDVAWLENLLQQARIMITAKVVKNFGCDDFKASKSDFLLREIGQRLITTFNTEKLMDIMEQTLMKIHIPSCYIFLFNKEEYDLDNCFTALKYMDYKRIPCSSNEVVSIGNLPATTLPQHRCYSMLFHLLGIEYEKYGIVLFEAGPMDLGIYQSLTIQLSTALKGTILLEKVAATNRELQATQAELVSKAHQAGMADIATDTLHNIGNVLNSVNTSVHLIQRVLDTTPVKDLERAINLLAENEERLEDFIMNDPRGKKLLQFLLLLEPSFDEAQKQIDYNLNRLQEKINLIDEIIIAQQTYAGAKSILEEMDLMAIIEDTLKMLSSSLERNQIKVVRNFRPVPKVNVQKNKLFHILVNLINNAQDAMFNTTETDRCLTLALKSDEHYVYIDVTDTGIGILPELLPAIFTGEFTTKKGRLGFGLRCCANYMAEMGGKISASSSGPGTGATFILQFAWNHTR
jgi:signal transduction histidine kinase